MAKLIETRIFSGEMFTMLVNHPETEVRYMLAQILQSVFRKCVGNTLAGEGSDIYPETYKKITTELLNLIPDVCIENHENLVPLCELFANLLVNPALKKDEKAHNIKHFLNTDLISRLVKIITHQKIRKEDKNDIYEKIPCTTITRIVSFLVR